MNTECMGEFLQKVANTFPKEIVLMIVDGARTPDNYDLQRLAEASEGYSGRQIEEVWCQAVTEALNDGFRPPTTEDALASLAQSSPTSKTMGASIQARRERLAGRATPASLPATNAKPKTTRKIAKDPL